MATILISGAGFNIFNEIGALISLYEYSKKHCRKYDNFAGTSAGGLLSVLLAMEWDPVSIANWFITPANYDQVAAIFASTDPNNILTIGSIFTPTQLLDFITLLITQTPVYQQYFSTIDPATITFAQLYRVTQKGVLINATNITNLVPYLPFPQSFSPGRPEIFSFWTSPDVQVATAVLAGISELPFVPPTQINGQQYIDGAYTEDFPSPLYDPESLNYYKKLYPCVTLPVDLEKSTGIWYIDPVFFTLPENPWSLMGLISYIPNLANFAIEKQLELQKPTRFYKCHTILLSGLPVNALPPIETIEAQYALGRCQAEEQRRKMRIGDY